MTYVYSKFKFIIISYVNKFNKSVNSLIIKLMNAPVFVHNKVHKGVPHCE